ncbi:MAG: hypothetical protein RIR79_762 [Pseudomonadota bacterium]|jgi:N-acetylmuramic acid 6-phosphate etherase
MGTEKLNTDKLSTEQTNADHTALDRYSMPDLVSALVDDQYLAVQAVQKAAPVIAWAVDSAVPRIQAGGRLIYMGAGTSGRLGLLDSVELNPTFSWDKNRAIACMAGGLTALVHAVEGAEDDAAQGEKDLLNAQPTANDVIFLIAASGRTPYVLAGLHCAKRVGALTVAIVNNADSPIGNAADIAIVLETGAEIISGSTRLKAGTAQKIALNTLSTAIMVRLNKVYGNLMVDLRATNAKLVLRAEALTMQITGAPEATARATLQACDYHIKTAVVALLANISTAEAAQRLMQAAGSVRDAIQSPAPSQR